MFLQNLRLQVQSVGQCNKELLKDKTELQEKVKAGSNASAETDVAVMNIALYKEKIQVSSLRQIALIRSKSCHTTLGCKEDHQIRRLVYRVGHLLADLGLVNSDLVSSRAGGLLLWLPTA